MPCVYTAPFATPVLPLVNRIAAGLVAADIGNRVRRRGRGPPRRRRGERGVSRRTASRPTFTVVRSVFLAQPSSRRARCAFGMPMNASGSASARHVPRFFTPMPGSISTGTAADLEQRERQREEVGRRRHHQHRPRAARRSRRRQPVARASLSAFSSAKVMVPCSDSPVGLHAAAREVDRGAVRRRRPPCRHKMRRDVERSESGIRRQVGQRDAFARNSRTRMITSSVASSSR